MNTVISLLKPPLLAARNQFTKRGTAFTEDRLSPLGDSH